MSINTVNVLCYNKEGDLVTLITPDREIKKDMVLSIEGKKYEVEEIRDGIRSISRYPIIVDLKAWREKKNGKRNSSSSPNWKR